MDQFLSRLLDKYGLLRIFIAALLGVVILWSLAHFTSASGSNVSVLWGLVQYTKKNNTDSAISIKQQQAFNQKQKTGESSTVAFLTSAENIVVKQQQAFNQKQKTGESSTVAFPTSAENIVAVHGIQEKKVNSILQSLRSRRQLRALEILESGQTIAEIPRGTYFFVSIFYMTFSEGSMTESLTNKIVNRFGDGSAYFEIHYPQNSSPILIGFTSESDAVNIASPSHGVQSVSISALPWEKMSSLIAVPTDKIISASDRRIDLAKGHQMLVIDAEIK
ncbi:hypothetical protein [Candidatus Electronema sp. PJ]|uniref:hypothetical protein n=1 Tax=Candidatus Electronema sp. PJ TaxID=3401572 RepID=UPI003AA913A3